MSELEIPNSSQPKLSRKEWKKLRRKKKRQADAQARDIEEQAKESPNTIARKEALAAKEEEERIKQDEKRSQIEEALWLEKERNAQALFLAKKAWQEKEKKRKEDEERCIKEEWEERMRKEKEEIDARNQREEERKNRQADLLKEATAHENTEEGAWHNPIAPVQYSQTREEVKCPFFMKTGACRFGDRCSRAHPHPESSCTLLLPGMFTNFDLEQSLRDEYDQDISLEYEERDTYQHFKDFYDDVLPEFQDVGRVVQFKVCCNYEPHLRGNVYIQFSSEDEALKAYQAFNGRFYGGRQLSCQFSVVDKWKGAICGLFHKNRCPKGKNCNFLHVFNDPYNRFWQADRDYDQNQSSRRSNYSERSQYGHTPRHSNYRSRSRDRHTRSRSRERRRSRSRSRDRRPSSSRSERRLSPSRSRDTKRSRSQDRKRSRSRDRDRNRSKSKDRESRSRDKRSRSRDRGRRSKSRDRVQESSRSTRRRSKSRSPDRNKSKREMSERKDKNSLSGTKGDTPRECEKVKVESMRDVEGGSWSTTDSDASPTKAMTPENGAESPSASEMPSQSRKHKRKKKHKKHKKEKRSCADSKDTDSEMNGESKDNGIENGPV